MMMNNKWCTKYNLPNIHNSLGSFSLARVQFVPTRVQYNLHSTSPNNIAKFFVSTHAKTKYLHGFFVWLTQCKSLRYTLCGFKKILLTHGKVLVCSCPKLIDTKLEVMIFNSFTKGLTRVRRHERFDVL